MNPVKIAIISDLHIGPAAKSQDMCPQPCDASSSAFKSYEHKISVSYQNMFIEFIEKNNIKADYLVIPGDITDTSHPMQIKLASEIIAKISKRLEIPENHLIYVPGNHDIDWSFFDAEDKTGIKWNLRYAALESEDFIFKYNQGNSEGGLYRAPYFSTWSYDNLFVLGYNSSNHDTPVEETHRGLIATQHINKMRDYLSSIDLPADKLKIFVIHHHLTNIPLPIPEDPDYSLATNAHEMIRLLQDFKFDFIIHGHRHHPHFDTMVNGLPILCSGSFSAEIDTKWNGKIQNQFHLLEFDRKDNNSTRGVIKSWSNTIIGWEHSDDSHCGIAHEIPFGGFISAEEKEKKLFPKMRLMLNSKNIISWKNILKEFPDYRYLSDKQTKEIISEFSTAENAEVEPSAENYLIFRES